MPYPNAKSVELKEKMNFLNARQAAASGGGGGSQVRCSRRSRDVGTAGKKLTARARSVWGPVQARRAGDEYYETLCMRGVNQSIGTKKNHRVRAGGPERI